MRAKIIGTGISGQSAEAYLQARGIDTVVVGNVDEKVSGGYDFCVVSPGVPKIQIYESVPVVPEVELPFYCEPKLKPRCLVAVTGTNGKTSIVKQISHLCQETATKSVLCGNVGVPVSSVAEKLHKAVAIVEVSSFMLEQTQILHPHIAVITNITADHLDRHGTMESYIQCKAQIMARQKRRDFCVINYDDENARSVGLKVGRNGPRVIWYSTTQPVQGYYVQNGTVWEKLGHRTRALGMAQDLGGMPHTVSNALAVLAVGRLLKLPLGKIWQACCYQPQAHRMELVMSWNGVAIYNDSKATNMAATLAAARSLSVPTVLILCGLSKGQDYHELLSQLPAQVEHVIVFGKITESVMTAVQALGLKNVTAVTDLNAAVRRALQIVSRPGAILFSPSGSSFDMFANYEHRGDEFKKLIVELLNQAPQSSHPIDAGL